MRKLLRSLCSDGAICLSADRRVQRLNERPLRGGYSDVRIAIRDAAQPDIQMSAAEPWAREVVQYDPLVSYGAALRAIVDHSVCQARVLGQDVHRALYGRASELVQDLDNPANFAD